MCVPDLVPAAPPALMGETPFGSEEFAAAANVSRETLSRLEAYLALLEDWNARHNLVSDASLGDAWRRHFWDSAQLLPLVPKGATSLVDLGAGAGFPGLVLAELLRDRPGFRTVLFEATGKKARFLEAVAARLGLKVEVRNMRIEAARPEGFDVVTARALAPLPRLLPYAQRFWAPRTVGLFLKSQTVGGELTEARKSWRMRLEQHPSQSDKSGIILEVRELRRDRRNPPD
jgi:16S rRNA (guanine527-N7)-methyltransferase